MKRYKFELVGNGVFLTNNKDRVIDTLAAYLDNDKDVQILICVGHHKDDDKNNKRKKGATARRTASKSR